jgi:gamma-glutamyltranspeptidase/glutathione hydrolase
MHTHPARSGSVLRTAALLSCLTFLAAPTSGYGQAKRMEPHAFLAEGRKGIVVGFTGPAAVHAGLQTLQAGGSAADAAMATAMTQVVEAAGSYVSFAGILTMTYYDAATGKVYFLNAGYNTPREENDPLSIPGADPLNLAGKPPVHSGRTALVPGFMAGVGAAHERFGKLPLARIFEPAIALAEDGYKADAMLAGAVTYRKKVLSRLPETRRIFAHEDGTFVKAGERFRQPELARTLRRAAAEGTAFLYRGEWARHFVDAVRQGGGKITLEDLKAYKAIWEEPVRTRFRGYEVFAPGFSSLGGVETVEALNLLSLADLRRYGPPATSGESLFWLMQITANQRLSYLHAGDAALPRGVDLSPRTRVTPEHARRIWDRMQAGTWPYSAAKARPGSGPAHSSGVVAVDRWGNVAAVTHSINAVLWGATGIFVGGISIPDSASFQQEAMKRAGPGNRLPDPMSPLVVVRQGKPVLASSAIGAGLHQKNIQALAGVLEFGLDAQAAVDAPAFLLPQADGARSVARVRQGAFDKKVLDAVRERGQQLKVVSVREDAIYRGYWIGVQIEPAAGRLRAAGSREVVPSHAEGY